MTVNSLFLLVLTSRCCHSMDVLSYQKEESFAFQSTKRLSRQDFWQVVRAHFLADNEALMDSKSHLKEKKLLLHYRDCLEIDFLPLKYSIQL